MNDIHNIPTPPSRRVFTEVKRKLKLRLAEYQGEKLGEKIGNLPGSMRNKPWTKALIKVNKVINKVTLNLYDFRNSQEFTTNLHILKQKWIDLEPEYRLFQEYCQSCRLLAAENCTRDEEVENE